MTTYHIVEADSLSYLGSVDAVDVAVAAELATAVWATAVKVLTWRPSAGRRAAI